MLLLVFLLHQQQDPYPRLLLRRHRLPMATVTTDTSPMVSSHTEHMETNTSSTLKGRMVSNNPMGSNSNNNRTKYVLEKKLVDGTQIAIMDTVEEPVVSIGGKSNQIVCLLK